MKSCPNPKASSIAQRQDLFDRVEGLGRIMRHHHPSANVVMRLNVNVKELEYIWQSQ